ncbi:MAG TPA: HD domain-containing phosphohydrolase [Usitatibacter sp.]|jgi:putative two-component system response regulator|nr:HD domain-containing phosphohydrolase [Usitatibacter sp.]
MSTADLHRLEALLDRSPHGNDPEAGPLLQRISKDLAERRARGSSDSMDTVCVAAGLLARFSGNSHGEHCISALLDCYRFFFGIADFRRALAVSSTVRGLAERTKRDNDVSHAMNLQGVALTELGDLGKALLCFSSSLEIAQRMGNVLRQASVLVNTGMALNYIGLHRDAILCLHQSISSKTRNAPLALCNLAQSYLELGQFEQGLDAIVAAAGDDQRPPDALTSLERCIREFTYVQLALAVDDVPLAWQRAQLCLDHSRSSTSRATFIANLVTAQCEVRSGREKRGVRTLVRLLSESEGVPSQSVDCLMALVKACDQIGQPETALDYLNRLLSLIQANRRNSVEGLLAWSLELDDGMPANLMIQESNLRARAADRRTEAVALEMLERLAVTADIKEDNTGEHGRRVGALSRLMAETMGWNAPAARELELAARLHDIGKIALPESLLRQPGPLQDHARSFMRSHCEAGAQLLSSSIAPSLRLAESIARCHHEAWNGSGYPRRLRETQIPLSARIVALSDAFDALTHDRSYSQAWTWNAACENIRSEAGSRFDPDLTPIFLRLVERLIQRFGCVDWALELQAEHSPVSDARRRIERLVSEAST